MVNRRPKPKSAPCSWTPAVRLERELFSPAAHWHIVATGLSRIELPRSADAVVGILDHLLPLRDPAHRAGQREQHRKHRDWESQCFERYARIEVDVRIKLALDEIFVSQRDLLELARHCKQRIVLDPEFVENFMGGLLHDPRARVVILI